MTCLIPASLGLFYVISFYLFIYFAALFGDFRPEVRVHADSDTVEVHGSLQTSEFQDGFPSGVR